MVYLFQVPGLKIYGLFAVSDQAVSEQYLVKYIVYYNDVCARKYTVSIRKSLRENRVLFSK